MHLLPKDPLTMPWGQCEQASTPQTLSGPENRPLVMLHLKRPFQIASLLLLSALVVFSFPVDTSNFSYSKKAEPSQLMFWIASTNIPWAFIVRWHMQNCSLFLHFSPSKIPQIIYICNMVNLTVVRTVSPSLFSHLYYKRVYKTLKIQSLKKTPTRYHCVNYKILEIKNISLPYQKSYCKLVIPSQKTSMKTSFFIYESKSCISWKIAIQQSSCKTVQTLILQTKDSRYWLNLNSISVVISKKEQICLRNWNRR